MRTFLIKTQYQVDHLSLRERIILLVTVMLALLIGWYSVVYQLQMKSITQTELLITNQNKLIADFDKKRQDIATQSSKPEVIKLIAKHKELTAQIADIDGKVKRAQFSYVEESQLPKLLYSLLTTVQGVSIEQFSTIVSKENTQRDTDDKKGHKEGPSHFLLTLKGDYFSIMAFLRQLENLSLHLYWDKFQYTVQSYPEAIARIEFFTIKPGQERIEVEKSGVTS